MIPLVLIGALAAGTYWLGARHTRRALQTTHGRQQRPARTTPAEPSTMELALADAEADNRRRQPPAAVPPTVALPRLDGSMPMRATVPRKTGPVLRIVDGDGHPLSRFPEWNSR